MAEHIVAVFETDAAADVAARDLVENGGIPEAALRRYKPDTGMPVSDSAKSPTSTGGFWAWLLGEEDGIDAARDHELYERGAAAGNAVLSVRLDDESRIDAVVMILNAHHPVQLESGEIAAVDSTGVAPPRDAIMPARAPLPASHPSAVTDEVIPLAGEQIQIGKRTVDSGVTRVRRYVVEKPVQRDVTLHGERVTIERRIPLETKGAPTSAFEARTVEVYETEEVPIVEKTARVVEEVLIRKEATERTVTVRDSVRHEEVDVSHDEATKNGR